MIDVFKERLVRLSHAAQHLPGRPHRSSLDRWTRVGVRGRQLETVLIGGRRYTSLEALARFVAVSPLEPEGACGSAMPSSDRGPTPTEVVPN
jgi:Protein of unknown function (DUF1580)